MVGVIISLLTTILVVKILLKKMKAQFVLFFGLALQQYGVYFQSHF